MSTARVLVRSPEFLPLDRGFPKLRSAVLNGLAAWNSKGSYALTSH